MIKVSVIVPVYNVEKYLSTCLDSVLAQTFKDFEVVCVNDGSTDGALDILNAYAQKDARIKVITQENQGLSGARNTGVRCAVGAYIYFLDSDDAIHPQTLEICHTLAQKENAQLVSFHHFERAEKEPHWINYDIKRLRYKVTDTPLYYQVKKHKWKVTVNACTKFYAKDLIKDIAFIQGITSEDYPHTYAVLSKEPKSVLLNLPLYFYRLNLNSISTAVFKVKHIEDYATGLNFIFETYKSAPKKMRNFVLRGIFPNILKQQLNRILKSEKSMQTDLFSAFAKELADFDEKGLLTIRGHKLSRYLTYKKLIKGIR